MFWGALWIRSCFLDSFLYTLGNLSIFLCVLELGSGKGTKNKNMALEKHFNQMKLRRDGGWHSELFTSSELCQWWLGETLRQVLLNNPALCWRGFTVIEQLYGRRGDSQMVLIKERDDSYCMPCCSLTLLEAHSLTLMLRSSHIFYVWDTHACDYFLVRHKFTNFLFKRTHMNLIQTAL